METPEVNTNEQPVQPVPAINYEALISEYSWWRSADLQRLFLVTRVHRDFPDAECKQDLVPTGVELLEVYRSEPNLVAWDIMVGHFEAGRLIKFVPPVPAKQ